MKKTRRRIKWIAVAVCSLLALCLVVLCPLTFWYTRQQERARARSAAPTVFITEPAYGVSAPRESYISVSATALGHSPITRSELWVDGELAETEECEQPEGTSPFDADFDLLVLEGPHMLFVRAINVAGIIGQSQPVGVIGEAGPREAFVAVTVEEGETLADIAVSYGTDSGTLQRLNPELGGQPPVSGTVVIAPAWPPTTTAPPDAEPPSAGPTLPPGGPGAGAVQIPNVPPLQHIQPAPSFTVTVPSLPPIVPGPGMTVTVPLPVLGVPALPIVGVVSLLPAAPSDLQAQVADCRVRLVWNDNAWNETRYEVWMAALGSAQRLVASLEPAAGAAAWYEFPAPQPGGLSFWVEAVNSVGKQPSNIVRVEVDAQCPSTLPSQLEVGLLDMTVSAGYDRVYCYVSLEGAPELRMPADDSEFIQVQAGRGDIATWSAASRKFVVPIPRDRSLEVGGECWGWSGETLNKLGSVSRSYTSDTWDGTRRPLEGEAYEMGLALQTFGGEMDGGDRRETYGYEDPTIPSPYDLREQRSPWASDSSLDPYEQWEWFWQRWLTWKWNGDEKKLSGFQIYLDGKRYKFVDAQWRGDLVTLPAWCGPSVRWEVTAIVQRAESRPSGAVQSVLPKCTRYGLVTFDKIHWLWTTDGLFGTDCDTLEAYGEIGFDINGRRLKQGCGTFNFYNKVKCGDTDGFISLCGPAYPTKPHPGEIRVHFYEDDGQDIVFEVTAKFWDGDDWSPDDEIANYVIRHRFSDLQAAQSILGCGKEYTQRNSAKDGSSSLSYTLYVYPNPCNETPPY